jgi:translation initiation factor IF-3
MRPRTDDHDYNFKLNHARRFMEMGSKVKFTVLFRGREMAHKDRGRDLLDRVEADLVDIAAVESKPRMEGRTLFMVMAPLNKPKIAKKGDSEEPLESNVLENVPEAVLVEDTETADSDELDL